MVHGLQNINTTQIHGKRFDLSMPQTKPSIHPSMTRSVTRAGSPAGHKTAELEQTKRELLRETSSN